MKTQPQEQQGWGKVSNRDDRGFTAGKLDTSVRKRYRKTLKGKAGRPRSNLQEIYLVHQSVPRRLRFLVCVCSETEEKPSDWGEKADGSRKDERKVELTQPSAPLTQWKPSRGVLASSRSRGDDEAGAC